MTLVKRGWNAYLEAYAQENRLQKNDVFLGMEIKRRDPVYLPDEARKTHMHVIGSTGSGKSKFLEYLIQEDIKRGHGVCVIDPHGDLYKAIIRFCADHKLYDRVIPFNPADLDHCVGFNPVRRPAREISYQVGRLIEACLKAWRQEQATDTPRLRRWLHKIFYALVDLDLTFIEARYFIQLHKDPIREKLARKIKDEDVRNEFLWLESIPPMQASRLIPEQIESVKNRLDAFISSDVIRHIFGQQERTINIRQVMEEGKILLVNLAEQNTISGDQADLMGILFVNEFLAAARSRESLPYEDRRPFYLYIDEFSRFVTEDIGKILDETRKYRLHLILAHQTLAQVREESEKVLNSIKSSAKVKVVFGGGGASEVKEIAEDLFFCKFNPDQIKLMLESVYFEPHEVTRIIKGHSVTRGEGSSVSDSISRSVGRSSSHTSTKGSGSTIGGSSGSTSGFSAGSSSGSSSSINYMPGSDGGASISEGSSKNDSSGFSHSVSSGSNWAHSESSSESSSSGYSETETTGSSVTKSESTTEGESESVVPWYEYLERKQVSSVQFRNIEEQIYIAAAVVKGQETRSAVVKLSEQDVRNIKVPFVHDPRAGKHSEQYFIKRAYKAQGIATREQAQKEIEERQKRIKALDQKQKTKLLPDEPDSFKGRPSKLPS